MDQIRFPSKQWQNSITPEIKNLLTNNLIQALNKFESLEPEYHFRIANNIEQVIFVQSNSRADYYHHIAKKIYQISESSGFTFTGDGEQLEEVFAGLSLDNKMAIITILNQISDSGLSNIDDPEIRKQIQHQLMILMHADTCQSNAASPCALPYCATMKNIMEHMKTCSSDNTCTVQYCKSSKMIVNHWKSCSLPDCCICVPTMKKILDVNQIS